MYQVFRSVNDPKFTAYNCSLPRKFWTEREALRNMWDNIEYNELEEIEVGYGYKNGKLMCTVRACGKNKYGDFVYYEVRAV